MINLIFNCCGARSVTGLPRIKPHTEAEMKVMMPGRRRLAEYDNRRWDTFQTDIEDAVGMVKNKHRGAIFCVSNPTQTNVCKDFLIEKGFYPILTFNNPIYKNHVLVLWAYIQEEFKFGQSYTKAGIRLNADLRKRK